MSFSDYLVIFVCSFIFRSINTLGKEASFYGNTPTILILLALDVTHCTKCPLTIEKTLNLDKCLLVPLVATAVNHFSRDGC